MCARGFPLETLRRGGAKTTCVCPRGWSLKCRSFVTLLILSSSRPDVLRGGLIGTDGSLGYVDRVAPTRALGVVCQPTGTRARDVVPCRRRRCAAMYQQTTMTLLLAEGSADGGSFSSHSAATAAAGIRAVRPCFFLPYCWFCRGTDRRANSPLALGGSYNSVAFGGPPAFPTSGRWSLPYQYRHTVRSHSGSVICPTRRWLQ